MPNFNSFTGIGHLGRDAEVRHTQGGKAVTNFSVAIQHGFGDHKGTVWLDVSAWGRAGEWSASLRKGDAVLVQGEIGQRAYKDKQGQERTSLTLNASEVRGLTAQERQGQRQAPAMDYGPEPGADDIPF